ncbi:MAG: M3 family metallopeptidase [Bacteroidetes bacterium]|nr:M3 family metallopeptidase [Bacteroidota bacterium]
MENPLLKEFQTPFESAPFDQIKIEHFIPAIEKTIQIALDEINTIVHQKESPTFENTIVQLENCGSLIARNSALLFNLNSAETSDELQKTAQLASPILTQFQNDIRLNEALFERIKYVFQHENKTKLSAEQNTLLTKEYKSFIRNGANLDTASKEKLRVIDIQLGKLSLTFGEHVLADTQAFSLHIEKEEDLFGLPPSVIEMAAEEASRRDKKGWVFTLDYPSYIPFMTYAENRELRKKFSLAFGQRGFQLNPQNNTDLILELVKLRKERAQLLGYPSHAAFILEERMAQSEQNVKSFLDELATKAKPAAQKEWEIMESFASKKLGLDQLEKWDTAYVSEKLKQAELDLDEQQLKPYFPLNQVLQGLFEIVKKLYGIELRKNKDVAKYHEEVDVYEVYKENAFYALLYTDFFPRAGKRNGAWMTSYRSQKTGQRPHISIVCNFSKPTQTKPSLLTFQEVTTLFHEFGHALHGMLANTSYSSLSGTSVFWDFVELPSQIMENWCYQPEALALYAKHYETAEVIPTELIQKIKKAAHFQQGLQTLRQLSFAYLDLSFHDQHANRIKDVKQHEKEQIQHLQFTKDIAENCLSTAFSHIFQGGYSAGYYSYKWAEVLDADAFELFLEKGIFDGPTAHAFLKHILSKGGTEHPMTLYKRFRGKEPDPSALLRRAGLT